MVQGDQNQQNPQQPTTKKKSFHQRWRHELAHQLHPIFGGGKANKGSPPSLREVDESAIGQSGTEEVAPGPSSQISTTNFAPKWPNDSPRPPPPLLTHSMGRGRLQPSVSSGPGFHLGGGPGFAGAPPMLHARRESFLYNRAAADEIPYYGNRMGASTAETCSLARPASRASSVASSEPQL